MSDLCNSEAGATDFSLQEEGIKEVKAGIKGKKQENIIVYMQFLKYICIIFKKLARKWEGDCGVGGKYVYCQLQKLGI